MNECGMKFPPNNIHLGSELDFLAFDQLIDTVEAFPYPRDVGFNYTGRLCSKFLLSFQNQNYIFTPA